MSQNKRKRGDEKTDIIVYQENNSNKAQCPFVNGVMRNLDLGNDVDASPSIKKLKKESVQQVVSDDDDSSQSTDDDDELEESFNTFTSVTSPTKQLATPATTDDDSDDVEETPELERLKKPLASQSASNDCDVDQVPTKLSCEVQWANQSSSDEDYDVQEIPLTKKLEWQLASQPTNDDCDVVKVLTESKPKVQWANQSSSDEDYEDNDVVEIPPKKKQTEQWSIGSSSDEEKLIVDETPSKNSVASPSSCIVGTQGNSSSDHDEDGGENSPSAKKLVKNLFSASSSDNDEDYGNKIPLTKQLDDGRATESSANDVDDVHVTSTTERLMVQLTSLANSDHTSEDKDVIDEPTGDKTKRINGCFKENDKAQSMKPIVDQSREILSVIEMDNIISSENQKEESVGQGSSDDDEDEEEEDEDMENEPEPKSKEEIAMTMRGFDVLDDLDASDEDNDYSDHQSDGSCDSDIPQDEIEAMLEAGLADKLMGNSTKDRPNYEEREKIVLEEKGHNHFDVLPEGWVQVTHNSGMPIFLHRVSRVCSLAKPYFLGPGSARKHEVPLSAIPCLQYQRAVEEEEAEILYQKNLRETLAKQAAEGNEVAPVLPSARIETVQENKVAQSLTAQQLQGYCRRKFRFKAVKVMRFKSWSDRRKFTKNRKQQKQLQRPTLPEGTKLIKFPVQHVDGHVPAGTNGGNHRANKEWIMNPNGKSYVCILHEYVQHALKKQPSYTFKELENAATPYSATVSINAMQYGVGYGTSKKQAKSDAAKATLEILIPEMRDKIQEDNRVGARGTSKGQDADLSFFDEIKIEDPRVAELCAKTTEPSPYVIFLTCLQRNFGLGEMHIKYDVNSVRHQKNEFTMTVAHHTARVVCKNKRDGKQRASQAILQLMHPHITSWGSLLRLYGNRSVKNIKEKKQDEQEITLLQSKASVNSPNFAILEKLCLEMRALKKRKAAIQPIGKFITEDLPTGNGANLNNVDL